MTGLHLTAVALDTVWTVVPDSGELIRRRIGSEPLFHSESLLLTRDVGPSGSDLHVITVPPVVWTRPIRCQVQGADRSGQARTTSTENVEITSLEVIVVRTH